MLRCILLPPRGGDGVWRPPRPTALEKTEKTLCRLASDGSTTEIVMSPGVRYTVLFATLRKGVSHALPLEKRRENVYNVLAVQGYPCCVGGLAPAQAGRRCNSFQLPHFILFPLMFFPLRRFFYGISFRKKCKERFSNPISASSQTPLRILTGFAGRLLRFDCSSFSDQIRIWSGRKETGFWIPKEKTIKGEQQAQAPADSPP